MSAPGLRDQLLRVYAPGDNGSDAYSVPVFNFVAEWWGRLDETRATVTRMQERMQMKLDAVAEFADEAEVPTVGMLKDLSDGRVWKIAGINSNRMLRRTFVGLERVTADTATTFTLYDAASPSDTTHLVDS